MKINAPLNLAGNQLSAFRVQNANIAGGGDKLPAMESSFAYDNAYMTMYIGVKDSKKNDVWTAILTASNIEQYIYDYALHKKNDVVGIETQGMAGKLELAVVKKSGEKVYGYIKEASDTECGLMSPEAYRALGVIDNTNSIVQKNYMNWNEAWSWGNHAEMGYTKTFNAISSVKSISNDRIFMSLSEAQRVAGEKQLNAYGLVLNETTLTLYAVYTTATAGAAPKAYYLRVWESTAEFESAHDIHNEGSILFVKSSATIYKMVRGTWMLVFESASKTEADILDRISGIESALGINGDIAGNIDNYIEVLKFLEGVSANDTFTATVAAINARISSNEDDIAARVPYSKLKLNGGTTDEYNIYAPTTSGSYKDSVIVNSRGVPGFMKTRMVAEAAYGMDDNISDNGEWKILVFDSSSPADSLAFPYDVCVKIYEIEGVTHREILADVEIVTETDKGQANPATRVYVKIKFYGNIYEGTAFKAVIIC